MIQRALNVADRPHRLEKNAPGDWYTTGECLWCGAPELEAPELLHPLTDDDLETYEYCDFVVDDVGALRAAPPWHPHASPRPVASAPTRRRWWQLWRRWG
jgi:hypothetical protein